MARAVRNGNRVSFVLDDEEEKIYQQVQAEAAANTDVSSLMTETQNQYNRIYQSANSDQYADRDARIGLQKDLYSYEANLRRLNALGYDMSDEIRSVPEIQKAVSARTRLFTQFDDEADYNGWKKFGQMSDAEQAKAYDSLQKEAGFYALHGDTKKQSEIETDLKWLRRRGGNGVQASIRLQGYRDNQTRIADAQKQMEALQRQIDDIENDDTFGAYHPEYSDLKKQRDELQKQIEAMQADVNRYVYGHAYQDEEGNDHWISLTQDEAYQLSMKPDFESVSANRDFNNPTQEQLQSYDSNYANNSARISDTLTAGGYYDEEGNLHDITGAIVPIQTDESPVNDKLGIYLSAGEEGRTEAYNILSASNGSSQNTWANIVQEGDANGWGELTDTEIAIYYYLLNEVNQESAYKYLEDMTTELTYRETKKRADAIDAADGLEKLAYNIASVPASVFGGIPAFIEDTARSIQGKNINPYSRAHALQNSASAIRESTAQDINDATGNASLLGITLGDVYQAGMSGIDSVVGALTLGGLGYGAAMGTGAASSEAKELFDRGASREQIMWGSALAGAAEGLFEKVSIDHFLKLKSAKNIGQAVKNFLLQGAVEGSEEINTEIANTITDALVMGSQSEFQLSIQKYLDEGKTQAEAEALALLDVGINVWKAGVGGFISGAGMGGASSIYSYAGYQSDMLNQGQQIIDNGQYDAVKALALDMAQNSAYGKSGEKLGKYASKVDAKINQENELRDSGIMKDAARMTGKLYDRADTLRQQQNTADIQSALQDKGLGKREAKKTAEVIGAAIESGDFSSNEVQNLMSRKEVSDAVDEILSDEKSGINRRNTNQNLAMLGYKLNDEGNVVPITGEQKENASDKKETETISNLEANKDAPVELPDGIIGKVNGIKYENGVLNASVTTESGETVSVPVEDVSMSREQEDLVAVSKQFGADAPAVYAAYHPGIGVAEYGAAMKLARDYGYTGVSMNYAESSDGLSALHPSQIKIAYESGEAAWTNESEQTIRNQKKGTVFENRKPGKVSMKGGTVEGVNYKAVDVNGLTAQQKAAVRNITRLAQVTGINFVFFQSEKGAEGKYTGANGIFKGNTIFLDINAGATESVTQAAILRAAAHEMTHFIERFNKTEYRAIQEFFLQNLEAYKGNTIDMLVAEKQARSKEPLSFPNAVSEIIADGCEMMLKDTKIMELLASEHESIARKISRWLKKWVEDLKVAFTGVEAAHKESRAMIQQAEKLQEMWDNALMQALRNRERNINSLSATVDEIEQTLPKTEAEIDETEVVQADHDLESEIAKAGVKAEESGRAKYSDRDSDGNALSTYQQKFFADSKARDRNGNLKLLFHGTTSGGFTVFDPKFSDDGISLFASDNINMSATYAGSTGNVVLPKGKPKILRWTERNTSSGNGQTGVYKVYFNLTNPLIIDGRGQNWDRVSLGEYDDVTFRVTQASGNSRYDAPVNVEITTNGRKRIATYESVQDMRSAIERVYGRSIASTLNHMTAKAVSSGDVNVEYNVHFVPETKREAATYTTREIAAQAKKDGHDGVILTNIMDSGKYGKRSDVERGSVYIAFSSEQVKSVDNKKPTRNPDIRYSERDTESVSNRSLLANALESAAQNDIERQRLEEYRGKIDMLNAEEQKLSELRAEIKELSFAKGQKDTNRIGELQFEANETANRINTIDEQLLRLEAAKPLQNVLQREKKLAYKRAEQKGKEALAAYRERAVNKQREIIDRYQESRAKGVERRKKTAMRHKIQNVVNELNQYLLKGNKEKHVMIGMQKAVAEALDAINMDTVGAEERIAKLTQEMMKAKSPEKIQEIARKIANIQERGDNMKNRLESLKSAYAEIKNSDDPMISNAHDDVIDRKLESVIESVGDTSLRDMTLDQLEDVDDMYKMVLTNIRNANKAFKAAKSQDIAVLGNNVMMEVEAAGGKRQYRLAGTDGLSNFNWNNMKPVYAFERIGSKTFTELFNNVRSGEDTWAKDITEAKEFSDSMKKKYGYKKWNFDKTYTFKSSSGMDFSLNLEQIMSLYAYSKRAQAKDHLKKGGIVFDPKTQVVVKTKSGIKVKYNLNEATSYNISDETLADIISKLTPEQKSFVDEMQDYLSTTMGEKGNEVSLEMYGIKMFKEKFYFPLKSASQFMAKAKEQQQGEVKIKNSGFSKETVQKASNPIVLSGFMDVWSNHVNEMSMYHAFVLPMEDFYRVYNYKTPTSDTMATESVEMFLQNAYGKGATQYIDQLLKDLNGGARRDPRESAGKALVGRFKKAAVFASASVVIQQPSAIGRALALINPKYFDFNPKIIQHKKLWAEVKKYAPVAIIKEMGYFDTDMGMSTVDYIKGDKSIMDKADEWLSKAPALADELTWCHIWTAVKRETLAKNKGMDIKSDEFLQKVGKRFTEVIVKTQVYDSVLSRSANMRSKNLYMNMITSFMAEPTTSFNMLQSAAWDLKRGYKGKAAQTFGSVMASVVLNALLVSLVYAARDDDEDETWMEKYFSSLVTELVDGANPITYIPIAKDIWSLLQGYDVERADMTLFSAVTKSLTNLVRAVSVDTSDMDEDALEEHGKQVTEAAWGLVDAVMSMTGIPVKNVRRDVMAAINTYKTVNNGLSNNKTSFWNEIAESVKKSLPVWGWLPDEKKGDKLYEAIISGDKAYQERIEAMYDSQNAIDSARVKALRDNDPRILEAATAAFNGDPGERVRIAREIIAEGRFSQDDVIRAINAEITKLERAANGESESEKSSPKFYDMNDYYDAIMIGDKATADDVKEYYLDERIAQGDSEEDALNSFESSFTSTIKSEYLDGNISRDKVMSILTTYGGSSESEAETSIKKWDFEDEYGYSWDQRDNAFRLGDITMDELVDYTVAIDGDAESAAKFLFDEQEIDAGTAADMLVTYSKMELDDAENKVARWEFKNKYGYSYDDRREAYISGAISASDLKASLMDLGGMTSDEADEKIAVYDWRKRNPGTDLDDNDIAAYISPVEDIGFSIEESGVSPEAFAEYRDQASKCKGVDSDGDGKIDSGSKKAQILLVINSLPISAEQKTALYFLNGWAASRLYEAPWH